MIKRLSSNPLDSIGIVASGLCMVHCILLPVLVAVVPVFVGGALRNPVIEWALLATVFPAAFVAIIQGYLKHRQSVVVFAGLFGLLCLGGTRAFSFFQAFQSLKIWMHGAGGLSLIYAHWVNIRSCQMCSPRID
jgi:hypothetical protein